MLDMVRIVIIGAGDLCREVLWLVADINDVVPRYDIVGLLDDDEALWGQEVDGVRCLGSVDLLPDIHERLDARAVIAMQDCDARRRIVCSLSDFDAWETLVHPSACVHDEGCLGAGCLVFAQAVVSVGARVGSHCLLSFGSMVAHDCVVGDFASVMPGARVSGGAELGQRAYVATNATVLPRVHVGEGATVGAGSVALRDVPDGATVMGVPARLIRG